MTKSKKYILPFGRNRKTSKEKKRYLTVLVLWQCIFLMYPIVMGAQNLHEEYYKLTLEEAIQFAKSQNKWVQIANIEETAVDQDLKDAYKTALPAISIGSSYQRFSDLTLFTEGLSNSTTGPRKPSPNAAALGADMLFSIYGGGKQRALQREQRSRLQLAKLNVRDVTGSIAFQTASQYLDMVRLQYLEKFIQDQLKRAQARLANIIAFYKNEKVTKSDVLRAEVALSNVELSLQQNQNDITIANQKLDVLLNIPDSVVITLIDTARMAKPDIDLMLPLIRNAEGSSLNVQKADENIEMQRAKVMVLQSGNMPSLNFYSAYGVNYPNYLFFPPVNQAYAIGFIGLKLQYNISAVYQNKNKLAAGKLRVKELVMQQKAFSDNVRSEVKSYYIKYAEALHRISVTEKSVEQARVNYTIVNTKYLNQLSLLTDLLDADNLYHESRLNLVKAQTDALVIYYHILYASGNL